MENLIVVESEFIEEGKYQNLKKEFNHGSDYFNMDEIVLLKSYLSKTCP